jgi:AcrR family transcriptional regulator
MGGMTSVSPPAPKSPPRPRRSSAETREHVLAVAQELFYWEGIHATGIDRVAAAAQVAPTTLYRLFASKDDLVAAYIERTAEGYREDITTATSPTVGTPRERILSIFDVLTRQVQPENCRGCPFLMALAEFPDPQSPVHVAAAAVKAWVRRRLHELTRELAEETPFTDPAGLADQLALVVEGVYGSVQALTAAGPAMQARATAEALIDAAHR